MQAYPDPDTLTIPAEPNTLTTTSWIMRFK